MSALFEKVKIGNLELKNRIVMDPMGFSHTDPDGGYSERQINYYVERAKGGFGLIYPTATMVTTEFEPAPMPNILENYSQATRLAILTDKVHQYGAKVCAQLSLGLGRVSFIDPNTPPKSASATPSFFFPDLICIPYTKDEIKFLVRKFGNAAMLAKNAGVDAIEMHAYGGYLIDQFLTPLWNTRTDEYGGSLENRMRIVYELRDAVWASCGKDFPFIIKITPDHQLEGARTLNGGIELAKEMEKAGFTALHLDMGCYECWYNAVTTVYQKEGVQLYIAQAIRDAGVKIPLLVQGKLDNPQLAEQVIKSGTADLIGLGHPALTDPQWPNKVRKGTLEDIVPCIGCNECIYSCLTNKNFSCAVNPYLGMENDYILTPAEEDLKVLIIGSGPGGMMAALTAAQRGFEVELWEKEYQLGGALNAAGSPVFKEAVAKYLNYLKTQLYKSGVTVRLGKEATTDEILYAYPDAVIIACGANPIIPNIEGLDEVNTVEATQMLKDGICEGESIIVLGGGLVGCEAALHLDRLGKNVTIVEQFDDILMTVKHATNNDLAIRKMMTDSNIDVLTGAKLISLNKNSADILLNDKQISVPFDTIILAVGYKSDRSLYDELSGLIDLVFTIGDNKRPAKIIDAVHEGFHTARLLEQLR